MKRVRIDDGWLEYGTKAVRPRAKKKVNTSQSELEPADPVFASIMEEISAATAAERAGWAKLERYLRPRVRVRM